MLQMIFSKTLSQILVGQANKSARPSKTFLWSPTELVGATRKKNPVIKNDQTCNLPIRMLHHGVYSCSLLKGLGCQEWHSPNKLFIEQVIWSIRTARFLTSLPKWWLIDKFLVNRIPGGKVHLLLPAYLSITMEGFHAFNFGPTGRSGPPSKLVPNIPVGRNRNDPLHLMYQPKLSEFCVEGKAPQKLLDYSKHAMLMQIKINSEIDHWAVLI